SVRKLALVKSIRTPPATASIGSSWLSTRRWLTTSQVRAPRARGDSMNKGIARSMDRRGSKSDKTPPVAQKQKFSDPSICDRCGAVYSGKSWRRGPRLARVVIDKAPWVTCPGCAQAAAGEYHGQVVITVGDSVSIEEV